MTAITRAAYVCLPDGKSDPNGDNFFSVRGLCLPDGKSDPNGDNAGGVGGCGGKDLGNSADEKEPCRGEKESSN